MRRRAELTEAYSGGDGRYSRAEFMLAVRDPKTWLHGVVQIMCLTVLYGFSVFLPIILRFGFGMTVKESQYLSIPVFFWGSLVYGVGAYWSDRMGKRFLFCVAAAPVGIVGYAILLGGADGKVTVGVKYFACFLIASCAWMLGGGNLAWVSTVSGLLILLRGRPTLSRHTKSSSQSEHCTGRKARRHDRHRSIYGKHRRHRFGPNLPHHHGPQLHTRTCVVDGRGLPMLDFVGFAETNVLQARDTEGKHQKW